MAVQQLNHILAPKIIKIWTILAFIEVKKSYRLIFQAGLMSAWKTIKWKVAEF